VQRAVLTLVTLLLLVGGVEWNPSAAERPTPPALLRADFKDYIKAFNEAGRNNWNKAHRLAAEADNPLGAKILKWWDYSRPGTAASFADIAAFIDENPDWPAQRSLQIGAEAAMRSGVSNEAVLAWYRWRDPVSRDGKLRYAAALLADGQTDRAASFVRSAWIESNFSLKDLRDTHKRFKSLLRPEDHINRLDRLLWDNHSRGAKRMFRYVDEGYQRLAEARLALRASAGGVDAAIGRVPDLLRADPGLVYERLRWRRKKNRDESSRALLHNMPEELGYRPKLWWKERAILTRRALEDGLITEAYNLASGHRQIDVSTFADAEWLAGWIALRFLNEPADALRHFVRLHDAVLTPISRARAAYWAGRAADDSDDPEGAAVWFNEATQYPGTFYGQLAAGRVGAPDAPLISSPDNTDGSGAVTLEGHELVEAVRLLSFFDNDRLLKPFVFRLSELARNRADHTLLAELALSIERPDYAIQAAQQAARDGYVSVEGLFPIVDIPFAREDAELEHALVLALTRQESHFDEKARSHAGARGLMQLMPATAKVVARRMRVKYARNNLTANPAYNISLGSTYLRDLIKAYDGSYLLAVAAYNGGPGNVRRWIRANGDPRRDAEVDIIDWIEMIPLRETRNYVQRVLEGTQVYRWRLGRTPTVASLEKDLARGMPPAVIEAHCGTGESAQTIELADLHAVC
jgi:soluble lytic murein transglycosylase